MALSADTEVEYADNQIWEYPVAASARIYKGALVNIDMAGRALPATDASGVTFAGLAQACPETHYARLWDSIQP